MLPFSSIETILSSSDFHSTFLYVVLSGRIVADKVLPSPIIILSIFSSIAILSATTSFSVIVIALDVPLEVFAVIVAVPTPTAVNAPVLLTVRILVSDDSQVISLSSAFDGYTLASREAGPPASICVGTFCAVILRA